MCYLNAAAISTIKLIVGACIEVEHDLCLIVFGTGIIVYSPFHCSKGIIFKLNSCINTRITIRSQSNIHLGKL